MADGPICYESPDTIEQFRFPFQPCIYHMFDGAMCKHRIVTMAASKITFGCISHLAAIAPMLAQITQNNPILTGDSAISVNMHRLKHQMFG
jgi:hypothetical protein